MVYVFFPHAAPPTPPLSLSSPLSAPLFKKRSVLLSNSRRKNHLEILTCLIALIILIKRLIQSYHIPLICCIQMYLYLLLKAERNWEVILRFDDLLCYINDFFQSASMMVDDRLALSILKHLRVCIENVLYK